MKQPYGTLWEVQVASLDADAILPISEDEKHGGGMLAEEREATDKAALAMLEAFTRSGANKFDLTIINAQGEKIRFRANVPHDDLRRTLPALLDEGERKGQNIIVRPRGPGTQFIQLDDLNADQLDTVLAAAFLALETSPENFQAWIALPGDTENKEFQRRLRKGVGADLMASGATRVAGSRNFKPKYAPDFPTVAIAHISPGLRVTPEHLETMGIVAAPHPVRAYAPRPTSYRRTWPNYQQCLEGAPLNHDKTGPDRSKADFVYAMTCLTWGWSLTETTARLMEVSSKAQERKHGERYAQNTVQQAAAAVERNRSR